MNLKLEGTNGMRLTGLFVSERQRNSVNALRKLRRYALARPSVCLSVRHTGGLVKHGWSQDYAIFTVRINQSINQSINIFCRVA